MKKGRRPERVVKGTTSLERLLGEQKVFRASTLTTKRKPTGEGALFEEIWNERRHQCEACFKPIDEACSHNFSHALPKNAYPDYRLDERNIDLLCMDCHNLWHQKYDKLHDLPNWTWVVNIYLALKKEAHGNKQE